MSMNLGYLVKAASFAAVFLAAVTAQIQVDTFRHFLSWTTIVATISQTLGTALGDWIAGIAGLGYTGFGSFFAALLIVVVAAYSGSTVSRTMLPLAAFILTRPLGAVVGDFLDKPLSAGGMSLLRIGNASCLCFDKHTNVQATSSLNGALINATRLR